MECSKLAQQATGYLLYYIGDPVDTAELANTLDTPPDLTKVLHEFADIFSEHEGLPPHISDDHNIPLLPNSKPPNIQPYRLSHSQKKSIEAIIKQMLLHKEIQPSSSPYSSSLILVNKKDKSWRLCADFRSLNDMKIKNKFPILVIEDLLDELHGATIFSKLDLRSEYHQIRMKEEDTQNCILHLHLGHYEYRVMPFGLSNTPATFQELMNSIFSKHLRQFVLVFFDDILVHSKDINQHKYHLTAVLGILR
jgi:hypothetical protein